MQVIYLQKNKSTKKDSNKFLYIYNQNKIFALFIKIIHIIIVVHKSIKNMIHLKSITIIKDNMLISLTNNSNNLLNKIKLKKIKVIYIEKIT